VQVMQAFEVQVKQFKPKIEFVSQGWHFPDILFIYEELSTQARQAVWLQFKHLSPKAEFYKHGSHYPVRPT
jgi:hypothetical protein